MKIKNLYVKKIKALDSFEIYFNENTNAIIGENGLGKTTILETLYNIITRNNIIKENEDFECAKIKVEFTEDELKSIKRFNEGEYYKNDELVITKEGMDRGIDFINTTRKVGVVKEENWINKVVYLPTDVNFKKYKVNTVKRLEESIDIGIVLSSNEMSLNLKDYLINIHYKDLEDMSIGGKPYRIEKFKTLYNLFFDKKEFIGVKDFEPLFRVKETGETHSADELSAGEKQIFFRGGSLLQMNLNNSVILIDEPELSLHPEWQQKILDFYKGIGENNQIIIATHSPHIISSCKKEEVIVLERKSGKTVVKETIEETYGWTVEQLLLSAFGLKSVRNPDVKDKLDKFKNLYINREKLTSNQLLDYTILKQELEKYLDPEDPSLSLINIKENSNKLELLLQKLKSNK